MMKLGALRESASSPSQEKCASECVRGFVSLCLHLFLNACVAEQQKLLTVNQASLVDFVGASPTTCTKDFGRVA